MKFDRLDLAITLILWLFLIHYIFNDLFLRKDLLSEFDSDILPFFGSVVLGIILSSPALIFYLNKNRPTFKESFVFGVVAFFLGYFVITALLFILSGGLFIALFLLAVLGAYLLRVQIFMRFLGRLFGNPKISIIIIAAIAVFAFALNLHWMFLIWTFFGFLFSLVLAGCSVFWNAVVRLIPSRGVS